MPRIVDLEQMNLVDSLVHSVQISFSKVTFHLDYILSYETQETVPAMLVFDHCSKIEGKCNLDVLGPDSILLCTQTREGSSTKVQMEMNTSASVMTIWAEKVFLEIPTTPPALPAA